VLETAAEEVFRLSEKVALPDGVRDFVNSEADLLRFLRGTLLDEMRLWGYEEVFVPTLELDGVLKRPSAYSEELLYRLFDRKGRVMVLRPDITQSVARLAGEQREEQLPLRYSYFGNAFRQLREGSGRPHEVWQAGFEFIGPDTAQADAEALCLGFAALERAGMSEVKACVGYPALAAGLYSPMNIPPIGFSEMELGIQALVNAPEQCVQHLERLVQAVIQCGLEQSCIFDMTLAREIGYYTGPVFEFYAAGGSRPLAGGGRYEHVCSRTGRTIAATGLAIDVLQVMTLLKDRESRQSVSRCGVLLGYEPEAFDRAQQLAQCLRKTGNVTEVQQGVKDARELCERAKQRKRKSAIFVTRSGYEEYVLPEADQRESSGVLTGSSGWH